MTSIFETASFDLKIVMLHKIYILLIIVACTSCHSEYQPPLSALRTVVVYMVAENNLYKNAKNDIAEMQAVIDDLNGNLLVYLDAPAISPDSVPQLFKIKNGKITHVKKYQPQNSACSETMQTVLNDAITAFPATEYGLVLWSHGTGWLPEGVFDDLKYGNHPQQRSFGLDVNKEMEIAELAENLPIKFEFIAFDACLMSNIETLYQLRNKANYIIASPTETLVAGFPYEEIVPLFFRQNIDYNLIVSEYLYYYLNQKNPLLQSASLCVTRTQYLETLAQIIMQNTENKNITISDAIRLKSYEYAEPMVYYDLFDLLKQTITSNNVQNELTQIFSRLIVSYEHTDYFLNDLPLKSTAGINFFAFPFADYFLENQYKQLDWYIDTELLIFESLH